MNIFKFGGASTASVDRIRAIPGILRQYAGEKILVVVSAMGKTTNALEKVAEAFYGGHGDEALRLFYRAIELDPNNASIRQNYELFKEINDRTNRRSSTK